MAVAAPDAVAAKVAMAAASSALAAVHNHEFGRIGIGMGNMIAHVVFLWLVRLLVCWNAVNEWKK